MGIIITIHSSINAHIEEVWKHWISPESIMQWNHASDDWHCPHAENELEEGGSFTYTMAAKDGSFSFDFGGIYDEVITYESIKYTLGDGRKVHIRFNTSESEDGRITTITEEFEAETTNPIEMQEQGWKMILENFKNHVENEINVH